MIRHAPDCRSTIRPILSLGLATVLILTSMPSVFAKADQRVVKSKSGELKHQARKPIRDEALPSLSTSAQGGSNKGMPPILPGSPQGEHRRPPTKAELETRVAKLELNTPGELELKEGQQVKLAAIPLDSNGNAIHGLAAEWESNNSGVVSISKNGEMVAVLAGQAVATVRAGTKTSVIRVTVVQRIARLNESPKKEQKSNRMVDAPARQSREALRAANK